MTVKNTQILTSWWDLIVEPLPSNPSLKNIPVIFNMLGERVLASWPDSSPTCLPCLQEHSSQDCPKQQPTLNTPTPNKSYSKAATGTPVTASSSSTLDPKTTPPQPQGLPQNLKGILESYWAGKQKTVPKPSS